VSAGRAALAVSYIKYQSITMPSLRPCKYGLIIHFAGFEAAVETRQFCMESFVISRRRRRQS